MLHSFSISALNGFEYSLRNAPRKPTIKWRAASTLEPLWRLWGGGKIYLFLFSYLRKWPRFIGVPQIAAYIYTDRATAGYVSTITRLKYKSSRILIPIDWKETEVNRGGLPKVLSLVDSRIVAVLIIPVKHRRYKQQHNMENAAWSDFIWRSLGLMTELSERIPRLSERRSTVTAKWPAEGCTRKTSHVLLFSQNNIVSIFEANGLSDWQMWNFRRVLQEQS